MTDSQQVVQTTESPTFHKSKEKLTAALRIFCKFKLTQWATFLKYHREKSLVGSGS